MQNFNFFFLNLYFLSPILHILIILNKLHLHYNSMENILSIFLLPLLNELQNLMVNLMLFYVSLVPIIHFIISLQILLVLNIFKQYHISYDFFHSTNFELNHEKIHVYLSLFKILIFLTIIMPHLVLLKTQKQIF